MRTPFIFLIFILANLAAKAQLFVDLALEDFVSSGPGFVTPDTTEDSESQDLSFVTFDIDGDGLSEIFISRPDLIKNDSWILYRESPDGTITKLGRANIEPAAVRIGIKDGRKGYYESYVHNDAARMFFNTFDEKGELVALWEVDDIQIHGKDKQFYDSIYGKESGILKGYSIPQLPIRQNALRRKTKSKDIVKLTELAIEGIASDLFSKPSEARDDQGVSSTSKGPKERERLHQPGNIDNKKRNRTQGKTLHSNGWSPLDLEHRILIPLSIAGVVLLFIGVKVRLARRR